ncbi:geranylgeranyl pyrophosphate synthase [Plasmodium ovale curtisi]|uniref:Geranylgeranyl pyrophosphate synthase n=1 Tax=Plasmodium ovale curtisi TaxID=864141 RepID=A0A1A8VTE3_PLAOA|nr:geranylgeranyl pyrophosphate synthase [Plasmodium ovale curtisi]SBS91341.1 geranylgeranyl pyrophosphate synthase [Plasmodium ovale curtisi]
MDKEPSGEEADNGLTFFRTMYNKYRDAFLNQINEYALEDDIKRHLEKYYKVLFDYNCLGGGILVILIYEYVKNRDINSSEWEKAACLAWCIEILQASFLVADDIMDMGETRRNKHCWYLLKDVETKNAVNDVLLLYNAIYKSVLKMIGTAATAACMFPVRMPSCCVLSHHVASPLIHLSPLHPRLIELYLQNESCYVDILAAFRDATLKTIVGQHLDTNIFSDKYSDVNRTINVHNVNVPEQPTININMINFNVYKNVVVHKTAYYSFFLPIVCGMLLAGISKDNLIYKKVEDISIMMGEYFQIHDDYLDTFGDASKTGKTFELCTEQDKLKIMKNYGKNNAACVKIIDSVYEQYNVRYHYAEYEKTKKETILRAISELHHEGMYPIENFPDGCSIRLAPLIFP